MDESRARGLQRMLASGKDVLPALYEECVGIAYQLAVRKLPASKAGEVATDAAADLTRQYLADPCYHVRSFTGALSGWIGKAVLAPGDGHKQNVFEHQVVILNNSEVEAPILHYDNPFDEIADNRKALADLCRSRSYRQAIRRIESYAGRRWCYYHAKALHDVYETFHRSQTPGGRKSRSGLVLVRKILRQQHKAERIACAQSAREDATG